MTPSHLKDGSAFSLEAAIPFHFVGLRFRHARLEYFAALFARKHEQPIRVIAFGAFAVSYTHLLTHDRHMAALNRLVVFMQAESVHVEFTVQV